MVDVHLTYVDSGEVYDVNGLVDAAIGAEGCTLIVDGRSTVRGYVPIVNSCLCRAEIIKDIILCRGW